MSFTITYGPISAALQLAEQSGVGQNWLRRFQIEQSALNRLDQQTSNALRLRAVQNQENAQDIQTALAYEQLNQRERLAQQELNLRASNQAADELYRQATLGLNMRAQGRLERKEQQSEDLLKAFSERFGMSPDELSASLATERVNISREQLEGKKMSYTQSPEGRTLEKQISNLRQQVTDAQRLVDRYSDPIAKDMGQLKPARGYENEFTTAFTRWGQMQTALQAANQQYQEGLNASLTGMLPQYGQQAARNIAAGGGMQAGLGQTNQITMDDVMKLATGIAAGIPPTLSGQQLEKVVAAKLGFFGITDPQVIQVVVQEVLAMRGR